MSHNNTSIYDINQLDIEGETALMKASKYGDTAIVSSKGADVHLVNSTGETALILASRAGYNDIVIKLGTAIVMATQEGHTEVLKTLIQAGANVNDVSTDSNDTPLHLVLKLIRERNHLKTLVQLLVEAGAKIKVKNNEGETPSITCIRFTRPSENRDTQYSQKEERRTKDSGAKKNTEAKNKTMLILLS